MKTNYFKFVLLFALGLFLTTACSKKGVDPDGGDTPSLKGADLVASFNFENGNKVDIRHKFLGGFMMLQPTLVQEDLKGDAGVLYINADEAVKGVDYGIIIMANINGKGSYRWNEDFDEDGSEEGVYIMAMVDTQDDSDLYYPFDFSNEKIGSSALEITSISKNKIKGSFSGTLYSLSTGEKLTISGQFDSGLTRVSEDGFLGHTFPEVRKVESL